MMIIMKFDDIYKPPFHDMFGAWVETEEGVRCFDWELRMNIKTKQTIIDILNGDSKQAVKGEVKYHGNCLISINGINILIIRGWGHLTGCGALNLSAKEAAKIQDDFGEWIMKKLKQEI